MWDIRTLHGGRCLFWEDDWYCRQSPTCVSALIVRASSLADVEARLLMHPGLLLVSQMRLVSPLEHMRI